jgi:hypothetical protein
VRVRRRSAVECAHSGREYESPLAGYPVTTGGLEKFRSPLRKGRWRCVFHHTALLSTCVGVLALDANVLLDKNLSVFRELGLLNSFKFGADDRLA